VQRLQQRVEELGMLSATAPAEAYRRACRTATITPPAGASITLDVYPPFWPEHRTGCRLLTVPSRPAPENVRLSFGGRRRLGVRIGNPPRVAHDQYLNTTEDHSCAAVEESGVASNPWASSSQTIIFVNHSTPPRATPISRVP
jgi:hypothetical protein